MICKFYRSHPWRHGYPPSGLRVPASENKKEPSTEKAGCELSSSYPRSYDKKELTHIKLRTAKKIASHPQNIQPIERIYRPTNIGSMWILCLKFSYICIHFHALFYNLSQYNFSHISIKIFLYLSSSLIRKNRAIMHLRTNKIEKIYRCCLEYLLKSL